MEMTLDQLRVTAGRSVSNAPTMTVPGGMQHKLQLRAAAQRRRRDKLHLIVVRGGLGISPMLSPPILSGGGLDVLLRINEPLDPLRIEGTEGIERLEEVEGTLGIEGTLSESLWPGVLLSCPLAWLRCPRARARLLGMKEGWPSGGLLGTAWGLRRKEKRRTPAIFQLGGRMGRPRMGWPL